MVIAQRPLLEGWKAVQRLKFKYFQEKASFAHNHVYVKPKDAKVKKIAFKIEILSPPLSLSSIQKSVSCRLLLKRQPRLVTYFQACTK